MDNTADDVIKMDNTFDAIIRKTINPTYERRSYQVINKTPTNFLKPFIDIELFQQEIFFSVRSKLSKKHHDDRR